MTIRFKGSDLIVRQPEELWTEDQNIVQEAITKTFPKKRNNFVKYKNKIKLKKKKEMQKRCVRRPYK